VCLIGFADVPAELALTAEGDGDRVEALFRAEDLAQVIIPNDHDPGVTIIHEVNGTLGLRGVVRGEDVSLEGRAIFEFLGS
jgi:hypothetical protein